MTASDSFFSLVAAKTFYFGVGGGTRDFKDFVRKRGLFDVGSVNTFTEGGNLVVIWF